MSVSESQLREQIWQEDIDSTLDDLEAMTKTIEAMCERTAFQGAPEWLVQRLRWIREQHSLLEDELYRLRPYFPAQQG